MYTIEEKIAISQLLFQKEDLNARINQLCTSNISDEEYYKRVAELEVNLIQVEDDLEHLIIPGEDYTISDEEVVELMKEEASYCDWDF